MNLHSSGMEVTVLANFDVVEKLSDAAAGYSVAKEVLKLISET